jgi:tetratricopeptide (TPR) repeat protein
MPRARLLVFILFVSSTVSAQDFKSLFNDAEKAYAKKDYPNAITLFSQARDLDSENAKVNYRLGMSYLYSVTKSKALPYLEKAYQLDPSVDSEINYHLGTAYQINNKYLQAKDHFEYFKQKNKKLASVANDKIKECLIADSLSRNPPNIIVENVGDIINTSNHEYSPIISADGSMFIFTSDRSDGLE